MKKTIGLLFALIVLVGVIAVGHAVAQALAGWGFYTATSVTSCPTSTTTYALCGVSTPPSIWASAMGAPYTQIVPVGAGSMSFSQITGNLSGSQLPATFTCTFSNSGTTMDGKGGTGGTAVIASCK